MRRGDVYIIDLGDTEPGIQGGTRPNLILWSSDEDPLCLDVMNDLGNVYAPYATVVPISSRIPKKRYPTDVYTSDLRRPGPLDGVIKCSYIFTIPKTIIRPRLMHHLDPLDMGLVDAAIKIALGIK